MQIKDLSKAKDIIDYWAWVERFTPPSFKDENSRQKVLGDENLPWLNRNRFDHFETETHTWMYKVFIGIISGKKIVEELDRLLPKLKCNDFDFKDSGAKSYLCYFCVDINGKPIEGSWKVPDYIAGMGCIAKEYYDRSDIWLSNFDAIKRKIENALENLFDELYQPDNHKPLCYEQFIGLINYISNLTEWREVVDHMENAIYIDSEKIKKPKSEDTGE